MDAVRQRSNPELQEPRENRYFNTYQSELGLEGHVLLQLEVGRYQHGLTNCQKWCQVVVLHDVTAVLAFQ